MSNTFCLLLVRMSLPLKLDRGVDTGDISRCGKCGGTVAIVLPAVTAGRGQNGVLIVRDCTGLVRKKTGIRRRAN